MQSSQGLNILHKAKPREPVIPSDPIPHGREKSLLALGAGRRFHTRLWPSGAAGRQQGKAPVSVPARRLAVPGTQPRRERGVEV